MEPTLPVGKEVVTMVKGDAVDDGMSAVQVTPEVPVAHESQTGPLSPVSSAMTPCMSCVAATMVGYGLPLTSIMPEVVVLAVTGPSVCRLVDVLEPIVTDEIGGVFVQRRDEILELVRPLCWESAVSRSGSAVPGSVALGATNEYSPIIRGMLATASRSARFCSCGR